MFRWMPKCQRRLWPNLALVGDTLSSMMSIFYWVASLVELSESLLGQSTEDTEDTNISIYVGMLFMLTAIPTAITQRELNIYHQDARAADEDPEAPLLPEDAKAELPPLTRPQKLALAGLWFTSTGDIAGALTAGTDLMANLIFKTTLPPGAKLAVQCAATMFGVTASVSNVKSCAHAMQKNAAKKNDRQVSGPAARGSSLNRVR